MQYILVKAPPQGIINRNIPNGRCLYTVAGGANSDTETEKENEPAKQWLSWVVIDLNQVAV